MFQNLSNLTKAVLFYVIAITLSLLFILLFQALWPQARIILHMLTPLLAGLIMLFVVTREGYTKEGRTSLGLGRLGLSWWGLALLLPLPVLLFSYGSVWITGLARLATAPGDGGLSAPLLNFLPNLLVGVLFAFGEEFSFRGYLLPKLMDLGLKRALVISGLLHGVWHLPLILLTPLYPTEGNLFIVLALFLLTLTAAGVVYGYLRLASNSLWPPTIFHGAFNATWDVFAAVTIAISPVATQYLSSEAGLLTFLGTAVAAAYFIYRLQHRPVALEQRLTA
jgi:membrane protease YdiL (CAAX protease family)